MIGRGGGRRGAARRDKEPRMRMTNSAAATRWLVAAHSVHRRIAAYRRVSLEAPTKSSPQTPDRDHRVFGLRLHDQKGNDDTLLC